MKLVCKSCKYEQIVQESNLTKCPRCGSNSIKIYLGDSINSNSDNEVFDLERAEEKGYIEHWERKLSEEEQESSTSTLKPQILTSLIGIILVIAGIALLFYVELLNPFGITLIITGNIVFFIGTGGMCCKAVCE